MAGKSLEGAGTISEEWVVGLYQYIFVSSYPKDALSDVLDATSAKTLAEVLRIPFPPLFTEVLGRGILRSSELEGVSEGGSSWENVP
jgi:hypothetical protein